MYNVTLYKYDLADIGYEGPGWQRIESCSCLVVDNNSLPWTKGFGWLKIELIFV